MKNNKVKDPELQKQLDDLQKSLQALNVGDEIIKGALKNAEQKYAEEKGDGENTPPSNDYDGLQKSLEGMFKNLGDRLTDSISKGFGDLKGSLPGTTATPTTSLNKSVEASENGEGGEDGKNKEPETKPVDKPDDKTEPTDSPKNDPPKTNPDEESEMMKSLNGKFSEFGATMNGLVDMVKSLGEKQGTLEKSFNEYLDAPVQRPQAVRGHYQTIQKGIQTDVNGEKVVSYRNQGAAMNVIESAAMKTADPMEKKMVNDAIMNYNICKSLNSTEEGLITRLTGVKFEQ